MDTSPDMSAKNTPEDEQRQKLVEIKVNAMTFNVPKGAITFAEVVALVFPDAGSNPQNIYSVAYKKGANENKPEGVLVAGASVKIKEGTRFSVSQTGQS
jgi:Multiubiquitin